MGTFLMVTISRTLRLIGMTLGSLLMLGQVSASFADSVPTSCDSESGAPSGFCASSTPGGIQAGVWRHDHDQASSQQGGGASRQLKVRQRQKLSATGTGQGARRYPLEPLRMMVTSQTRTAHCHLTPSQGPLREIPHNCPQLAIFS